MALEVPMRPVASLLVTTSLLCLVVLATGCRLRDRAEPDYARALRPGEIALQEVPVQE